MKKFSLVLMALMLVALPAMAQDAGRFTELEGTVTVQKAGGPTTKATLKSGVNQGDMIKTAKASKATVLFKDGSVLRLGPATTITINELVYQEDQGWAKAAYDVAAGTVMSIVGSIFGDDESEYKVKTPTAVSGVRGTMFIINVTQNESTGETTTRVVGVEGTVNVQGTSGGNYDVNAGQGLTSGPDGVAGAPEEVTDPYLQALLANVKVGTRSIDDRANELRGQGNQQLNPNLDGPELPTLLDVVTDPADVLFDSDNPADLIYQEPPQATELIIVIEIPGGGQPK